MTTRVTLAVPVDVGRIFDQTVTETQLDADTVFNNPDNIDLLNSYIEDAESEFRQKTNTEMRVARVGVAGQLPTFEQPTYKLSGHKITKGTFTGVWSEYLPEQKDVPLENGNILPFDPDAGDSVYFYTGLNSDGDEWIDVTDKEGDLWHIMDHVNGRFTFQPRLVAEHFVDLVSGSYRGGWPSFLKKMRFGISYRYGGLGGSRGRAAQTDLAEALDSTQTGSVNVSDGSGFPVGDGGGSIIVLVGREYMSVTPNPANDSMTIEERGVRGTTAEAHDSGDRVQYTPPAVRKAVAARAGMQAVQSSRYEDYLPDTEDSLDKSDVIGELESVWKGTVQAMS